MAKDGRETLRERPQDPSTDGPARRSSHVENIFGTLPVPSFVPKGERSRDGPGRGPPGRREDFPPGTPRRVGTVLSNQGRGPSRRKVPGDVGCLTRSPLSFIHENPHRDGVMEGVGVEDRKLKTDPIGLGPKRWDYNVLWTIVTEGGSRNGFGDNSGPEEHRGRGRPVDVSDTLHGPGPTHTPFDQGRHPPRPLDPRGRLQPEHRRPDIRRPHIPSPPSSVPLPLAVPLSPRELFPNPLLPSTSVPSPSLLSRNLSRGTPEAQPHVGRETLDAGSSAPPTAPPSVVGDTNDSSLSRTQNQNPKNKTNTKQTEQTKNSPFFKH